MIWDIDAIIVCIFLLTVLVIGFGYGRTVKTIEDYALGGRNFSNAALVATVVATWVGGSSFSTALSETYSSGLYYMIAACGMPLSFIILAYFFIPKMQPFLGKLSVAELIGDLYGEKLRFITAITGILSSVGIIAVQFKVIGGLVTYFSGISTIEGIVVSASIVTFYSTFGGIKAVTLTDMFQAMTFGFAIPIIGVMIWNQAYYDGFLLQDFTASTKFQISEILQIGNPKLLSIIVLFLMFAMPGIEPDIFQRISMGRNVKQVKKAFIIAAVLIMIIQLAFQWIPFLLYNVNPNLESQKLLEYLIDNYTYIGFKGLMISGIMAMAMSTADSVINSSAVLFAHDICHPLNISSKRELLISKIFSISLGIGGIIFAINSRTLLEMILTANSFYMPVVTVPIMLSILGFRTSAKPIWIAMIAGIATVIIWNFMAIEADPIIFAMLVNLIFLLGSHYLLKQPGGWVAMINTKNTNESLGACKKIIESLKYIVNLNNWLKYCQEKFPNNELSYVSLGLYFIIYTITTMYTTQVYLVKVDSKYVWGIYQLMMVTGTVLMTYSIWPGSMKNNFKQKIAQILWPIVILYMLIISSIFFVIMSNFHNLQFAISTVNFLIASILLGWQLSIIMGVVGFYSALKLHQLYNPQYILESDFGSPAFMMIYLFTLISASIVLFIKPKQDYLRKVEDKVDNLEAQVIYYDQTLTDKQQEINHLGKTSQRIINNLSHELRLPVGNVVNFSEMLKETLVKSNDQYLKTLSEEVYQNGNRLSSMILNMLDLAILNAKKVDLEKEVINLGELVKNCVTNTRKIYLGDKKINFEISLMPEIFINIDPNYMRQVINNLVINAINFSTEGIIVITLIKKDNDVIFTIKDEGKGIPRAELQDIFIPFKMGSNTESKAQGRGVGLALCKAAIESHGGTIEAISDGVKGAQLQFILPLGAN